MHLKNIQVIQFKNLEKVQINFSPSINCFLGINGSGKTNLLDSIYYLCLTKSGFNSADLQNITHGQSFFALKGEFQLGDKTTEVRCILEAGKKKQVSKNGKAYDKLSSHIGLLPLVLIAPDDTQLVKGGSEERRKFFDGLLSQIDKVYLERLIRYQHFLKQRNALIKNFSETNRFDPVLIEPYDRELIKLSLWIGEKRSSFLQSYAPVLEKYYGEISGKREEIAIEFDSDSLQPSFEKTFKSAMKKDLLLKRTSTGIHRDDFHFIIDGYPLKKFGSQGQQKSFLIALKLAQFNVFKEMKQDYPILLLDDIFDKLDDPRINKLISLVSQKEFGQLFITDARPERSKRILGNISSSISYFEVKDGTIEPEAT